MTLAKALGGGLPIGAMCTTERIGGSVHPGHARLDVRRQPGRVRGGGRRDRPSWPTPALLEHVRDDRRATSARGSSRSPHGGRSSRQVRGVGLMIGAVLDRPGATIVARCLERGLLINCTARTGASLRSRRSSSPGAQIDEGLAILDEALARMKRDLLRIGDLSTAEIESLLALAGRLKAEAARRAARTRCSPAARWR